MTQAMIGKAQLKSSHQVLRRYCTTSSVKMSLFVFLSTPIYVLLLFISLI